MNRKLCLIAALLTVVHAQTSSAEDMDVSIFKPALRPVWDQPRSAVDEAKVVLGKKLYFEKRISLKNDISCNSCHDLKKFGVDGRGFSLGFEGHEVGRNSPTVFNASGHIAQFWDGRATTVEEQAKGPILAAGEMGMPSPDMVVQRLKAIDGYQELFAAAFPEKKDPIDYDSVGNAIGAFERLLITPSRWDRFLNGRKDALKPAEVEGLKAFTKYGCTTCHSGTLVGGNMYQKVGLVKPWPNQKDQGRYDLTKKEADKMVFKVPSLRNIAKTGPYFHDASSNDLNDAIKLMGRHQLGIEIPANDIKSIAAFLRSMTGNIPKALAETPELPGSGKTKKSNDFE